MDYNRAYTVYKGSVGCVLIHGFTGTPWTYSELAPELISNNISVSVPLLPGHGSKPEDLQNVRWQDWYESALDAFISLKNRCDRVFVAGHSVGGAIALLIAARNDVNGVISLSTPLKFDTPGVKILPLLKFFVRCIKKPSSHFSRIREAGYDCYPTGGVLECVRLLKTLEGEIEKVRCPALFIHARGDRRVNSRNLDMLLQRVSSSEKYSLVLENSFHMITKSPDKEIISNRIISFINDNQIV